MTSLQRSLLFATVAVALVAAGSLPLLQSNERLTDRGRHLAGEFVVQEDARRVAVGASHFAQRLAELAEEPAPGSRAILQAGLSEILATTRAATGRLKSKVPEAGAPAARVEASLDGIASLQRAVADRASQARPAEARALAGRPAQRAPAIVEMEQAVEALLAAVDRHLHEEATPGAPEGVPEALAIFALGAVGFFLIAARLLWTIDRPLARLRVELDALARGELGREIPERQASDEVGAAMRALATLQAESRLRDDRRWAEARIAEATSAVQMAESFEDFGARLLGVLSPHAGLLAGVLYVDADSAEQFEPVAWIGCEPAPGAWRRGEGLVGRCASERATNRLADLSGGVRVSGAVTLEPAEVAFLPLVHRKVAIGVLELTLFSRPTGRVAKLLEDLPAAIAPALEVQRRQQRTERLAAEIHAQSRLVESQRADLLNATRELKARNGLLQEILASATDVGLVAVDGTGRVTHFNAGAERLLGLAPSEAIGLAAPGGLAPAEGAPANERVERPLVDRAGREFAAVVRRSPLARTGGEQAGHLYTFWDVSARKALERSLHDAREMAEQASRLKSDFLANMSHEIRTPLNAIIGFAQLLEDSPLDERQRDRIGKILASSRHLLGIINDILDISRIEAGRMSIQAESFDPRAMLEQARGLMAAQAQRKSIALRTRIDPALPERLVGDPLRLGQVLLNFASNAVKFTDEGHVELAIDVLERSAGRARLRLAVADTGPGLAPDQVARLFQPFTQLDMSSVRRHGGSGLGLAICRRLASLMDGEVGVDSAPGKGSRFWLDVALAVAEPGGALQAEAPSSGLCRLDGRRILLVEDNALNREVAIEMLQRAGALVTAAADGEAAVGFAVSGSWDVILMDLQMPGIDGFEATRRIRAAGASRLPVIAMTASALAEDRARCVQAGMVDFIAKPVDARLMLATIGRVLGRCLGGEPALPTIRTSDVPAAGPEIHREAAIDALQGNEGLYRRIVEIFRREHADFTVAFEAALADGRTKDARRLVHTLKSALASVGAGAASREAAAIESLLASDAPYAEVDGPAASLAERLGRVHRELEAAAEPGFDASGPDAASGEDDVQWLAALLAASDIAAMNWVRGHTSLLREKVGATCTAAIESALQRFDFDAALGLLRGASCLEETA